jgi:RNA polymerase sigma factor (sigma-70 family)
MPSQKKEWIVTEAAFNKLLARFDDDAERAAEEYETTRAQLARLFRYRGCGSPFELTDEVINRVARKIEEGEVIPRKELSNYFYGVARNVLREYLRNPDSSAFPIDELSPSDHPSVHPDELMVLREAQYKSELRSKCLEKCLEELRPESRKLIISYYEGEESAKIKNRSLLAEQMGVSLNSLRIRLHRIRQKLEKCVSGCMTYEGKG